MALTYDAGRRRPRRLPAAPRRRRRRASSCWCRARAAPAAWPRSSARSRRLPGVAAARLNLTSGKLTVSFEPAPRDPGRGGRGPGAAWAIPPRPTIPARPRDAHDREGRRLILALAVAGFGAMNAMMFSVPIWAGLFGQELGPATRTRDDVVLRRRRRALRPLRRHAVLPLGLALAEGAARQHGRADLHRRDPDPGDQLLRDRAAAAATPISTPPSRCCSCC